MSNKIETVEETITTNASGAFSKEVNVPKGLLLEIIYTAGNLATVTDITITEKKTGKTILADTDVGTSNLIYAPRQLEHLNTTGAALTTHDKMTVCGPLILTIAQGGNATSGKIEFRVAV